MRVARQSFDSYHGLWPWTRSGFRPTRMGGAPWAIGFAVCLVMAVANHVRAEETAPPIPLSPQTSQRISLDLKGVDILDVLKLLSQKSGLNFVAGRNVTGRVTIFVNDVDVWDVFELIIGANDLAYEKKGTIITVMMARDYELIYGDKFQERKESLVRMLKYAKVVQVATVLNQIKSSVGRVVADEATNTLIVSDAPSRLTEMREVVDQLDRETESRVYPLNYTDAEKLKEKIQPLLSPIGTFTFDARTNKVVISDLKEVLTKTDQIIHAFDVPDGEVLIDARIVNVTLTDSTSLGIDWQRVFSGVDLATRSNFDAVSGDILSDNTTKGFALQLLDLPSGNDRGRSNAKVVIEALKTVGKVEVISNPRIMVASNQEAKILVGTKEVFITTTTTVPTSGNTVNAPEVKTEDVGTKLYVTPNVKGDGYIQLKIRPEVSSVKETIKSIANTIVPVIQTTEAETNVLVKSGVTVIIGGLIDTKNNQTQNRIPWLGNLPILGMPFRDSSTVKSKTELVVFLTPQIVMPDGSPYVPPAEASTVTVPQPSVKPLPAAAAPSAAPAPTATASDPVPPTYSLHIRQQLQAHLIDQFREASLNQGSVIVSFILNHDGQVVGDQDISSPEGPAFIAAAKIALAQAQPFPPFPEGTQADHVRFRLAVDYSP